MSNLIETGTHCVDSSGQRHLPLCRQDRTITEGDTLKANQIKLWYNGKTSQPVTLVNEVNGGWIIRLANGMLVGPVAAAPYIFC